MWNSSTSKRSSRSAFASTVGAASAGTRRFASGSARSVAAGVEMVAVVMSVFLRRDVFLAWQRANVARAKQHTACQFSVPAARVAKQQSALPANTTDPAVPVRRCCPLEGARVSTQGVVHSQPHRFAVVPVHRPDRRFGDRGVGGAFLVP